MRECIIDGSHVRATDFDYLVIDFARREGFWLNPEETELLDRAAEDYSRLVSDMEPDDAEALHWLVIDAEDYLSDRDYGRHHWYVEESCLFRDDDVSDYV